MPVARRATPETIRLVRSHAKRTAISTVYGGYMDAGQALLRPLAFN